MTHHLLTQSGRASRCAPIRQKSANHYIRDDGAVMVEVRPGQFINEAAAIGLGLVQPYVEDPGHIKPKNKLLRRKKTSNAKGRH
jgi:hypothetical protein